MPRRFAFAELAKVPVSDLVGVAAEPHSAPLQRTPLSVIIYVIRHIQKALLRSDSRRGAAV
jgi:hypothetical protein